MANPKPLYSKKPDYFIISWMIVVHILAVLAFFHFSWGGFFSFLIMNFVTGCLGITFCFHRLLSHKSFKVHPLVEAFTALCGTLALQGTAQEWVSHHRLHHKASDTDKDPHNARQGFWHSHMGWLFKQHDAEGQQQLFEKYARDITDKPWLAFLSKPSVMIGVQVALGLIFLAVGGVSWVLWGIFLRLAYVYHVTWFVNSATHKWGYRNFEANDLARNNWWVGILAWGEGWHNNHHRFPNVCPTRFRWWEIDSTFLVIKLLKSLKLASDIRYFPATAVAMKAAKPAAETKPLRKTMHNPNSAASSLSH